MWNVKPGDMVVCVSDYWEIDKATDHLPKPVKGIIYTVRDVYVDPCDSTTVGLRFEEIVLPKICLCGTVEPGFWVKRFRPVRRNDISVLRSLLETPPKELVRG